MALCNQFSDWWTQNVSDSETGYQFAVCDLSLQLEYEFHFRNNTGILQIMYICTLLVTIFLSVQLPSYSCKCQYLLKYHIYTYSNIFALSALVTWPIFHGKIMVSLLMPYLVVHDKFC